MNQWSGKSKGTLLGYKIFVYCIKKLGIRAAYSVLVFVAFYYFIASPASFKAMYAYFKHRQQFSSFKAVWAIYKNYFVFGQTILDRVAIGAGLRNEFTFDFDGIDILKQLLSEKKGGILISAHIGNFEIAEKFFSEIDLESQIHIVTIDQEHSVIKEYLASQNNDKPNVQFIYIKEDLSHIFEINDALSKNHLICFTGDRYVPQTKTMTGELLGKGALFPAGTFHIASRLKAPIAFVYVMKESNLHYHLYTRRAPEIKYRDAQAVLNAYTESITQMLKRYPYQWFNYYDFWNDFKK